MTWTADAGVADRHLARIGFDPGDQLFEIVRRQVFPADNHRRLRADQRHRFEVFQEIDRQVIHRAARITPVVPPAPGEFSTITGWPRCGRMPSAMMRAMVSVDPPAASGTRIVTGRDGKDCALAPPIAQPAASAMAIIVFNICFLPGVGYTVAPRIRPGLGGRNPPRPFDSTPIRRALACR